MGWFRESDPAPSPTSVILRMVRIDSSSGYVTRVPVFCWVPSSWLIWRWIFCCCQSQLLSHQDWLAKFGRVTSSPSSATLRWFSLEWEGRGNGAFWNVWLSEKQGEGKDSAWQRVQRSMESACCLGFLFGLEQSSWPNLVPHPIKILWLVLRRHCVCVWARILPPPLLPYPKSPLSGLQRLLVSCLENHNACTQLQATGGESRVASLISSSTFLIPSFTLFFIQTFPLQQL